MPNRERAHLEEQLTHSGDWQCRGRQGSLYDLPVSIALLRLHSTYSSSACLEVSSWLITMRGQSLAHQKRFPDAMDAAQSSWSARQKNDLLELFANSP
ncbi:hypothetical protein MRB53_037949 [Persea americana]|nr:hypothetical protein MRB53_037949 [Persea americana]